MRQPIFDTRPCLLLIITACFGLLAAPAAVQAAGTSVARGVVFHDANGNGRFERNETPLENIRVSNGRALVKTNADGRYEIEVDNDDMLFVIKPAGWRTPLNKHNLPQFYYIHKPAGSPSQRFPGVAPTGPLPSSIDFPLTPQREPDQFKALLFGDPQPRDQKEVDYIAHDVVEELIGTDASFGVTLGDIVFDDLAVFEPLNRTIALIGIPWYNVIGNHDLNFDSPDDRHSDETYESIYGPPYYSFDYGQVHFLVLDDVEWIGPTLGRRGRYQGGFGPEQLEFVRNDLELIPEDQLVVLMMHIPLTEAHDRQELYRLIEQRPFCISIAGHTHLHEHRLIKQQDGWLGPKPHHHIINVTVSGSWWSGAPDERGIPHTAMADGAPNGYSIISFDGTKYQLDFKAAGRDRDYQMHIHFPEQIAQAELASTPVFANVFNSIESSDVKMRLGAGPWLPLARTLEPDPKFLEVFNAEQTLLDQVADAKWRALPRPKTSTHLWKATLPADTPAGTHLLEIRATNANGTPVFGRRVVRVTASTSS